MTKYIVSDGTPGSKVVVRDRHAALEIASLVSGFGDTGTATVEEVEDETGRRGGFGSTGTGTKVTDHAVSEELVRSLRILLPKNDEAEYREKMRKGEE